MAERYTRAHVCVRVRVCARVGMCVCAWVRGLLSRFFSRGCVRVGACACACARVGGVGFRAAGTLARGPARWICTIHHEHKGIGCFPSHKLNGYLPLPRTQGLSLPTNSRVILSHEPKGYISPGLACCSLLPYCL